MIDELSRVALRAERRLGEQRFPAGSRGTVVGAYLDGEGLEVEFIQPFHAVLTLNCADVEKVRTLRDVVPYEFHIEFADCRAARLLDVEVAQTFHLNERRWPGSHRNVNVWWLLRDGHAVGWNENPGRGWSFPVKALGNSAYLSDVQPK